MSQFQLSLQAILINYYVAIIYCAVLRNDAVRSSVLNGPISPELEVLETLHLVDIHTGRTCN